jgi:glucose dehydrogenase
LKKTNYCVIGLLLLLPVFYALAAHESALPEAAANWPMPGRDPGGTRYSPLKQITTANVNQLKVAWVYHMKPAGSERLHWWWAQPCTWSLPTAG